MPSQEYKRRQAIYVAALGAKNDAEAIIDMVDNLYETRLPLPLLKRLGSLKRRTALVEPEMKAHRDEVK